jgi:hypothetical protein
MPATVLYPWRPPRPRRAGTSCLARIWPRDGWVLNAPAYCLGKLTKPLNVMQSYPVTFTQRNPTGV